MRSLRTIGAKGITALVTGTLGVGMLVTAVTANADPAPGSTDIVGVGSDTLQYMVNFGGDGDLAGHAGYNTGKLSRLFSFDATPDANARAGYLNGSTSSSLKALNPTITLRGGKSPVQRPNGSGAGVNALIADTGAVHQINFVRSSSPLTQAQINSALAATNVGALREIRLAHDFIHVATADTTNAPALSADQLKSIYTCTSTKWTDVGGTSGDTIIPVIPQNGSGTRKTFLQDIGFTVNSDGSTVPALGGCVKTYEENDPYALYLDNTGAQVSDPYATSAVANPDAIEPMSDGRLNLFAAGYFKNPNLTYNQGVPAGEQGTLDPTVKLMSTGTPSDSKPLYKDERGLYIIFRDSDSTSATHFNGSTKNWVNTLFFASTGTPFFRGATGQALLTSAGVVADYSDCGVDLADASGCAPFSS